ncbi:MAG TPA: hydrogenase subunit MbhD domain-containing protein [Verrucomicrobiae bacterium]|jgi:energy-converting hydrogenase B subunit D|nr:hydrogenase subunit MbhD domain-containing protein [Verrucomicrobiae bacterium]
MHWLVEIVLYLFLIGSAIIALEVRNLLAAAITTSVFSFVIALLFVSLGAVDVGFTEAVVGAGIVGVYFIVLILKTTRRTGD